MKNFLNPANFILRRKSKLAKDKFSVGLDIGTQAIKVAKLRFFKGSVELCSFGFESVQLDLSALIKRVKQSEGLECVNIAASGPSTVIRYVNFPKMNKEELKQALKFEAQKHIPFSTDEINLDGYILDEDLPDNKMLVLIAAAKKDLIDQRVKLIEDAGLKVGVIGIDSIALVNAFNFNYYQDEALKNKAVTLLNIGATISNLDILDNGLPRLSRDIHIAGNNFTQKIADILGIDFKSAESTKLNPEGENASKVTTALESVLTNLAGEIRTSFDYYESQSASSVAKIFLSGGGSKLMGLKDMLANFLGIEVEYWDPLKHINLSSKIDASQTKSNFAQLGVAVGLALQQ